MFSLNISIICLRTSNLDIAKKIIGCWKKRNTLLCDVNITLYYVITTAKEYNNSPIYSKNKVEVI